MLSVTGWPVVERLIVQVMLVAIRRPPLAQLTLSISARRKAASAGFASFVIDLLAVIKGKSEPIRVFSVAGAT